MIAEAASRTRTVYMYMDREEPATLIDACNATCRVKIINFTDDLISRAFGIRTKPTWEAMKHFWKPGVCPGHTMEYGMNLRNISICFVEPCCLSRLYLAKIGINDIMKATITENMAIVTAFSCKNRS